MSEFEHIRIVEALLFAAAVPVDERDLAARLPEGTDVAEVLAALRETYAGRGVELVRRDRGWAFRTAPDLAASLSRPEDAPKKLSRAALETLAIIAYHQPATRAEIEEIRGVMLGKGTLDALFEAGWIRPRGRKQAPGRPMLWGTTPAFLDHFGLTGLDDLPGIEELKAAGLLESRPGLDTYASRAPDEEPPDEAAPPLDEEELDARALAMLRQREGSGEDGDGTA